MIKVARSIRTGRLGRRDSAIRRDTGMKGSNAIRWLGLVMAATAAMTVSAAERSGALSVAARVTAACDIGGSGSTRHLQRGLLDFGIHQLGGSASLTLQADLSQPVQGTLPIWCNTAQATPTVAFDQGLHAHGGQRQMLGPDGTLVPYQLLRGNSINAGDWDDMPHSVQITAGENTDIPVYGYIPGLPDAATGGVYTDTVTVQLDF